MFKKLWNKIKNIFTVNVQQPLLFKLNLATALTAAAFVPSAASVAYAGPTATALLQLAVFTLVTARSIAYLLESIAYRPDRYVTLQQYENIRAILSLAEIHRKAMVDEVKKMKKSKTKENLSNILGIPEDQR